MRTGRLGSQTFSVIGFSMLPFSYCPRIFSSLSAVFHRADGVFIRDETLYTRKSHECNELNSILSEIDATVFRLVENNFKLFHYDLEFAWISPFLTRS